jgi:hypothetical protein
MNILFFTPYYSMWNTTLIENLLMEELSKDHKVNVLYCNDFMKNICIAQDAEHKSIFSPKEDKLKICRVCKNNFKKISNNPKISYINIDNYIPKHVDDKIKELNFESMSNSQLLNYKVDNIEVGKMSLYEASLRKKKTNFIIEDKEERCELIDKLKQIIKFDYALKEIYSITKPDYSLTTNGFYYISNFFLKFFEKKNINTVSLSNSQNYKFAREDLRIFSSNELSDKYKLSENFKDYIHMPLIENSLEQALLNIESHINKEHSHSFSPKYLKKIDIKKKFNIQNNKKIVLVTLSSQAEIFSAKYVLSHKFKEGIFNTQLYFIKFILEKSKELEEYHFIIRTHPRQYIGNISEEIIEINKLDFNQYKNISINTPHDNLSLFNFIKDIDFIINSWSSAAVELGIFGINNITVFPEYALYPKECMNIIESKNEFIEKVNSIKKRNLDTSIVFLKYLQVENNFSVVSFKKNFFLSKLIIPFFSNFFNKLCFKFIYLEIWNNIKKTKMNTLDKKALKYFFDKKYNTFHEAKFNTIKERAITIKDNFVIQDYLIKNKINKFTKKNFDYLNF